MSSNDFKLTPQLTLLTWLIEHTTINNEKKPISTKEIANLFLKDHDYNNLIYRDIGSFLNMIYGGNLKKNKDRWGMTYNISMLYKNNKPIREVFIKDYTGIYDFNYYLYDNHSFFNDAQETYFFINKFFKSINNSTEYNIKPRDLIKFDNLSKDIILYCLNKGVPKQYLKLYFCYCMSFINGKTFNSILLGEKKRFKKNKVCAICGTDQDLTIHHIKKVSEASYLEFNNKNFMVLCDKCHKEPGR